MRYITALMVSAAVSFSAAAADTYTNPVFPSDWGSPTITAFRGDDGAFYGFIYQGWGRYSRDLVNWQDAYRVADDAGSFGNYTLYWPNVNKIDNRYVMYYTCLTEGQANGAQVAISLSSQPASYYSPHKVLVTASQLGLNGVNQPFMVSDGANRYLFVASPGQGIYALKLTTDGLSLAGGDKIQLTSGEMQCPRVCYRNGYYYLFAQADQQNSTGKSTTNIVVGRSKSITGPYVDGAGGRMLDGYFHTAMAGNSYFFNPSNISPLITDDAGNDWIIYNAVQASASHTYPVMLLDRVQWLDEWPLISDGYPSYYRTAAPVIR